MMNLKPVQVLIVAMKPVAHVATFLLATFAQQPENSPTSCRGKEVGEIWGEP